MNHHPVSRRAIAAGMALSLVWSSCAGTRDEADSLPSLAAGASVTVYPVLLAGHPSPQAAQAMGVLLERAGMRRIELAKGAFAAPAGAEFAAEADAFGAFVADHPMETDYALFASFVGTPGVGVDEVRVVLADRSGAVVLSDSQGPGDAAFARARPGGPMECALLAVDRLRKPLHLDDPTRSGAPEGAMTERLRVASGMPDESERAEMDARLATLRDRGARAEVVVYPVRIGDDYSTVEGEALARAITDRGLWTARASNRVLPFEAEASSNQQRTLWTGAASIRQHLQRLSPEAEYVVAADFLMNGDQVWGVHLYVCDRAGELVLVDFQNSHHDDFRAVDPASRADCLELAMRRLSARMD